jgi:hypothetical protein
MLHSPIQKSANKEHKKIDLTALASTIGIIIAIVALVQSYQGLYIQNISTNFTPTVIPYIVEGDLGVFNYNQSQNYFTGEGNLNLSLIVITPHAMILNFTGPESITIFRQNYTVQNKIPILEQNNYDANRVYVFPHDTPIDFNDISTTVLPHYMQQYVGFVQPGVTQMNFSFPLKANLFFNEHLASDLGQTEYFGFSASVGTFNVKMELYDVQTQKSTIEMYSSDIAMWINVNP